MLCYFIYKAKIDRAKESDCVRLARISLGDGASLHYCHSVKYCIPDNTLEKRRTDGCEPAMYTKETGDRDRKGSFASFSLIWKVVYSSR